MLVLLCENDEVPCDPHFTWYIRTARSLLCGAEAILLGFQHYIVMLGTIVIIPMALVPQMGGGNSEKADVIQTMLFVAGLNTLLQTMFGTRLPAVIGSSYTYVPVMMSIILSGRWTGPNPIARFKKTMRAIQVLNVANSSPMMACNNMQTAASLRPGTQRNSHDTFKSRFNEMCTGPHGSQGRFSTTDRVPSDVPAPLRQR
ncbi:xanthine/uracil/vitamin C permease [Artemisia annua]|uniref:Xanthine/uracil/vitamin C permease n=1 Tax=Artemisia annua TaxID=35608 RepID=A0A2U1L5X3_ARTAN|nr:xanthine/uracil/vitamin C permease [Artemisia annua]